MLQTFPFINDTFVVNNANSLNPYHAKFLKWNNPPSILGTVHNHFRDINMKT